MRKIFTSLLLIGMVYSQQQVDIPWPTLANSDWPMIKHDPQFTGRSPFKGPQTPNLVWTVDMPYGIFSGPVIGEEGNLYFGSYYNFGDYFYCYDTDGKEIWNYKLGKVYPPRSGIVIDSNNTIYFGASDGYFYALNPDGTLKWEYQTFAAFGFAITNVDLQGNLYLPNDSGQLFSFSPAGNLNWSVTYESGFRSRSPVFSPDGNTIYIAGRDSNLFALNLDGSLKWKLSCGKIQSASMVDSEGNIYFVASSYLYSIDSVGNLNWNYWTFWNTVAIPTIDKEGNVYVIAYDTTCCPYYPKLVSLSYNGEIRWQYIFDDEESDEFRQPLICDSEGTVYVGSTNGSNYYAISGKGKLKWKLPLIVQQQQVDNTGAIANDGTLYIGVHDVSLLGNQKKTLLAIRDTGTVSVNENNDEITDYSLSQNYPNPFNPMTTISYKIKERGLVQLKVYDVLGKEVATLVKQEQLVGNYSVKFDGNNLSSGVYLYRMQAGSFSDTKKFILIK
ncbi:MAG: PQQ-binding-like beta-propeller repeat protein [Ignavibacteriaceae bacterium]